MLFDVATRLNGFYDQAAKDGGDAVLSLSHFSPKPVKLFYSDNAPELMQAAKILLWPHDTSAPEVSQTNGLIERQVRILEEGTRTVLLAAGLYQRWWPWAGRYFSSMRNYLPLTKDGKSPYELRFKHGPFPGLLLPFGHYISFLPGKRLSKQLGQFEPRGVPGIFLGWKLNNGCTWSRQYYVARLEDFETEKDKTKRREIHVHKTAKIW